MSMSEQQMKKNKNSKIVDMLVTGVGVLFVSKVVVVGNIFKLNVGGRRKRTNIPILAYNREKFRHISNPDLSKQ